MSYPDPRYLGDEGEISAVLRPANAEPDLTTSAGSYHYLATTASTDGEFGLYRVDMAPKGGGPSTHFHKTISESFFMEWLSYIEHANRCSQSRMKQCSTDF